MRARGSERLANESGPLRHRGQQVGALNEGNPDQVHTLTHAQVVGGGLQCLSSQIVTAHSSTILLKGQASDV